MATVIHASAPGKLILHGEHAVVHGKLAVAASLDLRASLTLSVVEDPVIHLQLSELDIDISFDLKALPSIAASSAVSEPSHIDESLHDAVRQLALSREELHHGLESRRLAVEALLYLYCGIIKANAGHETKGLVFAVRSDLPIGAGLGSSAAYSVCLASSMLAYISRVAPELLSGDANPEEAQQQLALINAWAFLSETIIHGKPSGLDNTISCYGNAVSFASGKFTRLPNFHSLDVVLVDTGIPRSTKTLVSGVKARKDQLPTVMDPILDAMGEISKSFLQVNEALTSDSDDTAGQFDTLETLITMNHQLLNAIGVGHAVLDEVVSIAHNLGLPAKLTGAGGGGCAFILIRPGLDQETKPRLFKALETRGLRYWTTKLGGQGASITLNNA
eukprot:m.182300 g.182300  ORF g.182300 m.182300 type:complete len:390 (+) comp16639_c7_seq5:85-1254(+)